MFIFEVYGGFEETAHGAFGDFVVEGVEDVAAGANFGAKELGVIDRAGKAVVLPYDDAALCAFMAEGIHHGLKLVSFDDAGAALGFVLVDVRDDEVVFGGPFFERGFLLLDGEFLVFVAAIAQVAEDSVAGGKGKFAHGRLSQASPSLF